MGEALFDLEQILISRKESLTSEEAKLLYSWKQNAVRDFGIAATAASISTWLVTGRLKNLIRVNLTAGAGFFFGIRSFAKCLESGVGQILSQHGTRLQTELAEIMLKKYQHDPQVLQRFSKYFFSENVYDDDSTDRPRLRWRMRNLFEEDSTCAHVTGDDDSTSKKVISEKTDLRKTNLQNKQVNDTSAAAGVLVALEDPFDCVLGPPGSVEYIQHPDALSTPPRRRNNNHKRSHRRRRMHQKENIDV